MVYPALLQLIRTTRLPVVNWTHVPRRFKCTRPFRRKTKYSFCACAITFQTRSTLTSLSFQRLRIGTAFFAVYLSPVLVTWRPIITGRPERLPVYTPFLAPPSSCAHPLLLLYFFEEEGCLWWGGGLIGPNPLFRRNEYRLAVDDSNMKHAPHLCTQ